VLRIATNASYDDAPAPTPPTTPLGMILGEIDPFDLVIRQIPESRAGRVT
jgi:hypothetical protein